MITGRPNPIYHEIPDLIKALHLGADVILAGQVPEEELRALYQYSLSYVFPSFYEGFGLPPLEAMQCGVPVAASNQSAIPEVCGEGNALFFDPYDPADIKDKMKQIASDSDLRKKLIERGLGRVKEFDWKKMAEQVLNVYHLYGVK